MNKVYAVTYSDCIHESAHAVITLHTTMKGCVKAMIKLKSEKFYERLYFHHRYFPFGDLESIKYRVIKLND